MSRAQLTSTVEQNSAGAAPFSVAGKNKIINGDFGIWQRGTSFSYSTSAPDQYYADRFKFNWYGPGSSSNLVISQQAFTAGSAPVAGYEAPYFLRLALPVSSSGTYYELYQRIEDVRTLAGQTVTFSFWARNSGSQGFSIEVQQNFGSGGSSTVYQYATAGAFSSGWARYSYTFTLGSLSGLTIGTGSFLQFKIYSGSATASAFNLDLWGWQVERGSVATPFTTASNTLQGELALCQRYYYTPTGGIGILASYYGTTSCYGYINLPVFMRTTPTITVASQTGATVFSAGTSRAATAIASDTPTVSGVGLAITTSSATAGNVASAVVNNGAVSWSAEL